MCGWEDGWVNCSKSRLMVGINKWFGWLVDEQAGKMES